MSDAFASSLQENGEREGKRERLCKLENDKKRKKIKNKEGEIVRIKHRVINKEKDRESKRKNESREENERHLYTSQSKI